MRLCSGAAAVIDIIDDDEAATTTAAERLDRIVEKLMRNEWSSNRVIGMFSSKLRMHTACMGREEILFAKSIVAFVEQVFVRGAAGVLVSDDDDDDDGIVELLQSSKTTVFEKRPHTPRSYRWLLREHHENATLVRSHVIDRARPILILSYNSASTCEKIDEAICARVRQELLRTAATDKKMTTTVVLDGEQSTTRLHNLLVERCNNTRILSSATTTTMYVALDMHHAPLSRWRAVMERASTSELLVICGDSHADSVMGARVPPCRIGGDTLKWLTREALVFQTSSVRYVQCQDAPDLASMLCMVHAGTQAAEKAQRSLQTTAQNEITWLSRTAAPHGDRVRTVGGARVASFVLGGGGARVAFTFGEILSAVAHLRRATDSPDARLNIYCPDHVQICARATDDGVCEQNFVNSLSNDSVTLNAFDL